MNDRPSVQLPASILGALMAILDIVVLERVHGGAFRQLSTEPSPSWFSDAFSSILEGGPVTLAEAFPVLDPFLSEAEVFWSRTAFGRLDGEAFVVGGPGGHNLPLTTVAVALEGRHFLLIHRIAGFDDRQQILQRARERALEHEQVIRRLDGLRRPLERLTRIAGELEATPELPDPHRKLLASVNAELDTMRQILDQLPKLPPGKTARRR
jgi:hypothetical protein